jgi:hypothetical protein
VSQRFPRLVHQRKCAVPGTIPPSPSRARRLAFAFCAVLLCGVLVLGVLQPSRAGTHAIAKPTPSPTPNPPVVINFSIISASRGAAIMRSIYPDARITIDGHANAAIVVASGYDEQGMRTIASGIDVKNPTDTAVDTYQLKIISPDTVTARLGGVFPSAHSSDNAETNLGLMGSNGLFYCGSCSWSKRR